MGYRGCPQCGKTIVEGQPCPFCDPASVAVATEGNGTHFCTSCGSQTNPKKAVKGSFLIEVVLWLCFLIPGLVYSIWRLTTKQLVCRACGHPTVIPANSPMAHSMRAQMKRP